MRNIFSIKKNYLLLVIAACLAFAPVFAQQRRAAPKSTRKSQPKRSTQNVAQPNYAFSPEIRWTGTIKLVQTYSGLIGTSEKHIDLLFTNALPTLYRNVETTDLEFEDDKGTGTCTEHAEVFTTGERGERQDLGTCDCRGDGKSELHEVVVDLHDSTYSIQVTGPPCKGGTTGDGSCIGDGYDIAILKNVIPSNRWHLEGMQDTEITTTIGKIHRIIRWNLNGCPAWNDPQTRLQNPKVDPRVKEAAMRFIKRVHDELCIKLKVAQAYRTNEEQKHDYEKGRNIPGAMDGACARIPLGCTVTDAHEGESYHNYGLAIDVFFVLDNGDIDLKTRITPEVAKIGTEEGFTWGGDWPKKKKDFPHFQMTFGQKIKDLKRQHATQ
jgi:hypothetical protein